ncbi:MAG: DUF3846 domain-containing protein [Oscillospiraceae bacterium]|nr:DUF3846 domain-containing protein [Oscillospiraceae bacterium]MBQ8996380.1 DUF3846 domain-containing protein [Oscillospiraceae bacterium]
MKDLTCILKPVGGTPEVKTIENTLEELQRIVGGYIEVVDIGSHTVIICNEEGKIRSEPKNFWITTGGEAVDYIAGDAIICGTDGENFCSIDPDVLPDLFDALSTLDVPDLGVMF